MGLNRFLQLLILLVTVYLSSTTGVSADESPGGLLLDQLEDEVTVLRDQVEQNYRQRCEFLSTCGGPMNCSRNSCWPLDLGDKENYLTCTGVVSNQYCPSCQSMNFDYTRSYLRLASTTDTSNIDTAAIICSQRELDATFKTVCNQSSQSRAFLGTVDGTYIQYPGSELAKEDCSTYDPRIRPWYIASTSVQKAVMVLVDGAALGSPLQPPLSGTFVNAAYNIVTNLLNTLSDQDAVNIIIYDSSNATNLSHVPVLVPYNVSGNSAQHSEFSSLLGNLSSAVSNGGSSNVTFGVTAALENFASYDDYMKIIIVFTDGTGVVSQKNNSLAALQGQNVKVFVFTLPDTKNTAPSINSALLTELQSLGGSFNALTSTQVKNPLLAILPYFSFLAKFRVSLNDSADYSLVYEDFQHVVNNTFSITKPAFADDGSLLGTVGLNIFVDQLPVDLAQSVNNSLQGRTGGKAYNPQTFVLTAANASIQTGSNPTAQCNGSTVVPPNAGLCALNDTRSSIQDLACCGPCGHKSKVKYIIIGTVAGVAFIVIVLVVIYRLATLCRVEDDIPTVFPGDQPAPGTTQHPTRSPAAY